MEEIDVFKDNVVGAGAAEADAAEADAVDDNNCIRRAAPSPS